MGEYPREQGTAHSNRQKSDSNPGRTAESGSAKTSSQSCRHCSSPACTLSSSCPVTPLTFYFLPTPRALVSTSDLSKVPLFLCFQPLAVRWTSMSASVEANNYPPNLDSAYEVFPKIEVPLLYPQIEWNPLKGTPEKGTPTFGNPQNIASKSWN